MCVWTVEEPTQTRGEHAEGFQQRTFVLKTCMHHMSYTFLYHPLQEQSNFFYWGLCYIQVTVTVFHKWICSITACKINSASVLARLSCIDLFSDLNLGRSRLHAKLIHCKVRTDGWNKVTGPCMQYFYQGVKLCTICLHVIFFVWAFVSHFLPPTAQACGEYHSVHRG